MILPSAPGIRDGGGRVVVRPPFIAESLLVSIPSWSGVWKGPRRIGAWSIHCCHGRVGDVRDFAINESTVRENIFPMSRNEMLIQCHDK